MEDISTHLGSVEATIFRHAQTLSIACRKWEHLLNLPAAADFRAALAAGSTKTASLHAFLQYVRNLYPHLAGARQFACRPNGLLRARFQRYQDRERAWETLIRDFTGGERDLVIGFGNASIGNQLGGRPHGALVGCNRQLKPYWQLLQSACAPYASLE